MLEPAGFDCTPANQVRAWRVLDSIGQEAALRDPAQLKLRLAPLFARSAEGQKLFYEVFDKYVDTLDREHEPPKKLRRWPGLWKKSARIALACLAVAALAWLIWLYFPGNAAQIEPAFEIYKIEHSAHPEAEPADAIRVVGADTLHLRAVDRFNAGDSVYCRNTSNYAGRAPEYFQPAWKLEFASGDGRESLDGGHDSIWIFEMPDIRSGEEHYLSLTLEPQGAGKGSTTSSNIFVACNKLPQIPKLSIPANPEPGRVCNFAIADPEKPGLRYRWQIIGDTVAESAVLKHTFNRSGVFGVQFLVRDTTQPGACSADTIFQLQVGNPKVTLPFKTLVADRSYLTLELAWAAWLLLALLAVAAAWYWWRWRHRPDLPPDAAIAPLANTHADAGIGADRPPYYIPYRDQKGAVRVSREQFRFADALRLRQQSDELLLDVPDTLRATIMAGGYPEFRYRYRTRPSEYLFLVDEQMPGRHLARLFRHLAETLRGQDVVLDVVWYDAGFRRFWGKHLPGNLGIDGLRRFFPYHRLVLLGTGHALIDQHTKSSPQFRSDIEAELRFWPQRLLLTPARPIAWNWREALLYRRFGLYPADLQGMLDAVRFVENNLDTGDMPLNFQDWKAAQIDRRKHDARLDFQAWRSLNDHEAYLGNYPPMLRRWFLATAVSPEPGWELTLAIGRSIDAAGVTHEHLLALARIPALQEGRLHPGLRREMLKALDSDTERIARQAVLAELEAIQHLTADSHVAGDTAIAIAIQQFLLRPDKEAHRDALRALFENGALTRVQEAELNVAVENGRLPAPPDDTRPTPANIRGWLEAWKPAPAPPEKPFFTADLFRAAALTTALAMLAALFFFAIRPPNAVYRQLQTFIGKRDSIRPGQDTPKHWFFLRESWQADSAVMYNNRGAATGMPQTGAGDTTRFRNDSLGQAAWWFAKARDFRKDYALAGENYARAYYDRSVIALDEGAWDAAILEFSLTEELAGQWQFPALSNDALHGRGLAHYYRNEKDSADAVYQRLLERGYFDTLRLRPNLATLLIRDYAMQGDTNGRRKARVVDLLNVGSGFSTGAPGSSDTTLWASHVPNWFAPDMIPVKGGTFTMGSPEEEEDRSDDEKQHQVTLSDFLIGKTEITIGQYLAFCDETKTHYPAWLETGSEYHIETGNNSYYKAIGMSRANSDLPVTGVSWDDAVAYCQWLSRKTGKNYRLPTEAEWEYAARGGNRPNGFVYAGSNNIGEVAWYSDNAGSKTHPVGKKKANELGIHDMSGNVWEWCADWYGDYPSQPQTDPQGPKTGSDRVGRGGSWGYDPQYCRVAYRHNGLPGVRLSILGFRLAASPQ